MTVGDRPGWLCIQAGLAPDLLGQGHRLLLVTRNPQRSGSSNHFLDVNSVGCVNVLFLNKFTHYRKASRPLGRGPRHQHQQLYTQARSAERVGWASCPRVHGAACLPGLLALLLCARALGTHRDRPSSSVFTPSLEFTCDLQQDVAGLFFRLRGDCWPLPSCLGSLARESSAACLVLHLRRWGFPGAGSAASHGT